MDLLQPAAAIVLVLGLLAAALFVLRKRGAGTFRLPGSAGSPQRRLEVLERIALGPQHSVHLVRVGERCVLIGTAPSSCQLLETYSGTLPMPVGRGGEI